MNLLTGFMQFVGDDKKNIKALVNTFFSWVQNRLSF